MEKRNYGGIDVIKLICALLIITIHIEPLGSISGSVNSVVVNVIARVCVPFFFVASGYFLFAKIDISSPDYSVIKRYIIKLFKFYLIWLVVYTPFLVRDMIVCEAANRSALALSWLQNLVFSAPYGFLWYLPGTIVAVALIALMLKCKANLKIILIIGAILYAIGLLGQSYFGLLKPLQNVPALWNVLKGIGALITTTRNGVFEGLIFVSIGMALSKAKKHLNWIVSGAGFALSMALLLCEVMLTAKYNLKRDYDMYLMLIPAATLLFEFGLALRPKCDKACKTMRVYSTLIYFTHYIFYELTAIKLVEMGTNSLVIFVICVVETIILDTVIYLLSRTKTFALIKNTYS